VVKGLIHNSIPESTEELLHNPDQLFTSATILKDSKTTTAGIVTIGAKEYFLKRCNNKGFIYSLKYAFRPTRPFKVLDFSTELHALGIKIPAVMGALETRRGLLLDKAWLITEVLTGTIDASGHMAELVKPEMFSGFVTELSSILKKIHESGIAHGDLKMHNILAIKKNDTFTFGLMDFDGATQSRYPLPRRKRICELARVISSWILNCRTQKLECDFNAVKAAFINKYFELTGIDLSGRRLDKRINYLVNRTRKK
jgi:tRNA A-37 threonylcarbamoyl transferase component Bud32